MEHVARALDGAVHAVLDAARQPIHRRVIRRASGSRRCSGSRRDGQKQLRLLDRLSVGLDFIQGPGKPVPARRILVGQSADRGYKPTGVITASSSSAMCLPRIRPGTLGKLGKNRTATPFKTAESQEVHSPPPELLRAGLPLMDRQSAWRRP